MFNSGGTAKDTLKHLARKPNTLEAITADGKSWTEAKKMILLR